MRSIYFAGLLAVATLGYGQLSPAADAPLPVEKYARPPVALDARMSPDGKKIALIASNAGRQGLYIHDLEQTDKEGKLVPLVDLQAHWIRWKSNNRLIAGLIQSTDQLFPHEAARENAVTRMISVDGNGENIAFIGEPPGGFALKYQVVTGSRVEQKKIHPQIQDRILSLLPGDPDHLLQSVLDEIPYNDRKVTPALYLVDVITGRHQNVGSGDKRMLSFGLDSNGSVRLGYGLDGLDRLTYIRDTETSEWRLLHRQKEGSAEIFHILAFVPDHPDSLYILANDTPGHQAGLWSLDGRSGRFTDLIDPKADINAPYQVADGKLVGYSRLDGTRHYLDPDWENDYLSARKAMQGKNLAIIDRAENGSRVLFEISQPHYPKVWWILDRTTNPISLWPAFEEYPDITPERVAPVREVTYKARDGLEIPAFVTVPLGYKEGPIPFIVLPHGGPYVCEGNQYDYESQFLASRGWGVLRPNFRGTSCYGPAFEQRGYGQWGYAMQDDVTDGTKWLIDQKLADPSHICIVGGSYGGYAALEGAVKEPNLYRCAAAWAPVTDLLTLRRDWQKHVMHSEAAIEHIGEDDDRLDAASPARHAEAIQIPILLMHGEKDFTVQVNQSKQMESRLRSEGKMVEAVYLDDADHYRLQFAARLAWMKTLESFLTKYLATAS
jgi:dipeptidyl aminopeptidase/acylaminoacyl peptidase